MSNSPKSKQDEQKSKPLTQTGGSLLLAKGPAAPEAQGCTTSFLTRGKGELDKECGAVLPDPKEEYVQKDEDKESGGEA